MIPFGCDHSLDFDREILHHEDGSCVAIDWFPSKPEKISSSSNDALPSSSSANGYKICIFLPCLGGHSDHKFAMNFALTLHSAGYHTAIVTTRGIGVPLRTSSAWHPAFSDDAYLTLHYIHSLYGHHAKLFFAGFSAGANIVTETLMRNQRAETSRQIPIIGALCVCLVGSYSKTRDELELTPMGKLYSFLMANKQKDILRSNEHAFRSISKAEMDTILWSNTLREFDNAAQKVLFGFETPEELDAAFSCRKIRDIAVPCMGIQPRDDPLHLNKVRENIPLDYLTRNPHFIYVEPSAGNHFGFYEGESITEAFTNTTSYTWPAKCALAFWEALLKDKEIDLLYNR